MVQASKTATPLATAKWDKLGTWQMLEDDIENKLNASEKTDEAITLEIGPQLLHTLRHPSSLRCTSHFSSKLGEVFTAHYNKGAVQAVKVWTIETKGKDGTCKQIGVETEYEITCMTYVSKHRVYLGFCTDLCLRIFTDVHNNFVEVFTLPTLSTILCLIYNKEEDEVFAGGNGFLEEWKIQGAEHAAFAVPCKKLQTELTMDDWVRDIIIDKQKHQLLAMHGNGICVVSLKTRKQIYNAQNKHDGPLKCFCYYPQFGYLATGGADGRIKLFNGGVFNLIHVFMGHHGPVTGLEAHPKDSLLFSCSLDGTVRLWRLDSLQLFMRLDIGERILHMSLLGTTEFYVQTANDIMIYNLNQFYELFAPVESETMKLMCCKGKNDVNRILGSTEDGSVRLFSPMTGLTLTIVYPMPSFQVLTSFAYDIQQDNLHTVLTGGEVLVYNTATNPCTAEEIWTPSCEDEHVNNILLISVICMCIVGQLTDISLNVMRDTIIATLAKMMEQNAKQLSCKELEHDEGTEIDNLVFAGLTNGQLILCEATICSLESPVQAHEGTFTCLEGGGLGTTEFSKMIVSGGTDNFVKLWRIKVLTENRRPTVSLSPLLKIYLPSVPTHVCMLSNCLYVAIKSHTKLGLRWRLVMYQLVKWKKLCKNPQLMPLQVTHPEDEDHTEELTALDKCSMIKVVLTAGKDGFVKIWNMKNELLREMNFLTPLYASCFANDKGDLLVGYGTHVCSVSVVNYLPLNHLRSVLLALVTLQHKDDIRELPVKFDHKYQPWLDIRKLKKYSIDILERRRQHLEEEVIEKLKQATEDNAAKFVIFVDAGITKVIRKDFADKLLNWAKTKTKFKFPLKTFDSDVILEGTETTDRKEDKGKTQTNRKDEKPDRFKTLKQIKSDKREYLDPEGLIEIYPSTVGRALNALTRRSISTPEEMKLFKEKELLKKDPIIAPDGYIPNSVIRRKLKPPKIDAVIRRIERPFQLKPVPKVNPDHLPSWWGKEDDKETTLAKKKHQPLEFVVAKWEDTPSPPPLSEVISPVSSVSLESLIESPVKKYIHEGRSTSPKPKRATKSQAGRKSKGRSVSRDREEVDENVKKMIKVNNQSTDNKKKSVWEDSTSSDRPETVGLSVPSSAIGDTHRSPTNLSETSLDGKHAKIKPTTPATYKSGSARSSKSRISSGDSVKSKRLELNRYDLEMGTPDSMRKGRRSGRGSVEKQRSFKLTNLAVDEDSSAIHVKQTKSGRRPKSNLQTELIQQLMQEKWMPSMEGQFEYEDVLDNLIDVLDTNSNPVVYDSVCTYLVKIFQELGIPEDQYGKTLDKLGINLNNINTAIKKYTVKTLQVLGQDRTDVLVLILPKLVDRDEPIRQAAADCVEHLTGARDKETLLKILDEMGLTGGIYSSREDEELAMKVLSDRFADREDDPELFSRIQNWVEGTTPGLFDEERDDEGLLQDGTRSRKSSMYHGNKEQSFMSERSVVDLYDTSRCNTMYADLPPTPSEFSELALSRDVSMHDPKSAGVKSEKSRYNARMELLLDRAGASVFPGERDELPTPISDGEYERFIKEHYGQVTLENQFAQESSQSPLLGDGALLSEKSNVSETGNQKTPNSLDGMLLKERTLTDVSQVGPLPSFHPADSKIIDTMSVDSAFESATYSSDCATSHFSEKVTVSHMDQQSSKHSQLSEENNMFDVELVSTLEYEGELDMSNLSQITAKTLQKHEDNSLNLEKKTHSMLSEKNNSMLSSDSDFMPGEITVQVTPRESTSVGKKETSRQGHTSRRSETGSTLKRKLHDIDGFSTISDRSTISRKSNSTPGFDKRSLPSADAASHRPDTSKSGRESYKTGSAHLTSVSEPKVDNLNTKNTAGQSIQEQIPITKNMTIGAPANSLAVPIWEESTMTVNSTSDSKDALPQQDMSAISLDTLMVSKEMSGSTVELPGMSKETTDSTFAKEMLNYAHGLPTFPEEPTPLGSHATPRVPLNTPGVGQPVDLSTVSPREDEESSMPDNSKENASLKLVGPTPDDGFANTKGVDGDDVETQMSKIPQSPADSPQHAPRNLSLNRGNESKLGPMEGRKKVSNKTSQNSKQELQRGQKSIEKNKVNTGNTGKKTSNKTKLEKAPLSNSNGKSKNKTSPKVSPQTSINIMDKKDNIQDPSRDKDNGRKLRKNPSKDASPKSKDEQNVEEAQGSSSQADTDTERFTPKDHRLHKYYDKQIPAYTHKQPVLKEMDEAKSRQKLADRDSDINTLSYTTSSQITDRLSGQDSGISRDMSEFNRYGKGYPYGARLSPVKSTSELSSPGPQKGPKDPKDWRKFFELPNAMERRQMEQIKKEMEEGKLKPHSLPPISYFAEDLPMLPGEAGTRLLQSVRVGEKVSSGDGRHRIESVPSKLQVHTQNEPAGQSSFGILQMQWTTGVPTVKDKLSPPRRIAQQRDIHLQSHDTYLLSAISLQRLNENPSEEELNLPYLSTVTPPFSDQPSPGHYEWEYPLPPPPAKESRILVPTIKRDHDSYCKYYQLIKKKLQLYTSRRKEGTVLLPEVFVRQIREKQRTQLRNMSKEPTTLKKQRSSEKSTLMQSKIFPPIKIGQLVNIF